MTIDFDDAQLETIKISIEYSKREVRDAQGVPLELRTEKLRNLDSVLEAIRVAKRSGAADDRNKT